MQIIYNILIVLSWGIGLAILTNLSRRMFLTNTLIEAQVSHQKLLLSPEYAKLQQSKLDPAIEALMKASSQHPEAQEIEASDEIVGVIFDSGSYPPSFDGDASDYYSN
jgi:hypothetical protein